MYRNGLQRTTCSYDFTVCQSCIQRAKTNQSESLCPESGGNHSCRPKHRGYHLL
ncbi:hypothetical protein [Mariniphaga sp.]|uniref:hypothetical protein n=1 Tax=Mariniphaga sp. TaxID=1954475 RepID=UPI0035686D0F